MFANIAKFNNKSKFENIFQPLLAPSEIGQSEIQSFFSAKYRVSDLFLCTSSDESQGDGCTNGTQLNIFSEEQSSRNYDAFVPSEAEKFEDWIDFLEPKALEKIGSTVNLSSQNAGKYLKVVARFYPPERKTPAFRRDI
jgi:hypothetical protein